VNDDRFDRIDHTLDRLLALAMDHGRDIAEVKDRLGGIETDIREIRKQVVGIHEALTEHLTWHLGRT
jgi:hypothetical protein